MLEHLTKTKIGRQQIMATPELNVFGSESHYNT